MVPTPGQHRRMHLYWARAEVTDRDDRLALTSAIVARPLATSNELTADEANEVIGYLAHLHDAGQLAAKARRWLTARTPERSPA